ncbi:Hypothetical predicted protein [Marmota monax]|uniref:Uncharacterized protein n=1 Tax=Marmota monax TaxID=9995 RepID=A0A5E4C5X3_MARMO|nr:Hypothetical predicted protein [Marmota monax]
MRWLELSDLKASSASQGTWDTQRLVLTGGLPALGATQNHAGPASGSGRTLLQGGSRRQIPGPTLMLSALCSACPFQPQDEGVDSPDPHADCSLCRSVLPLYPGRQRTPVGLSDPKTPGPERDIQPLSPCQPGARPALPPAGSHILSSLSDDQDLMTTLMLLCRPSRLSDSLWTQCGVGCLGIKDRVTASPSLFLQHPGQGPVDCSCY